MTFGLDLPLLMIIESGLKQEAMLKDRLEYIELSLQISARSFLILKSSKECSCTGRLRLKALKKARI